MSSPLSSQQMADVVHADGGGSFDWHTGAQAQGPGVMVALEGAEETITGGVDATKIDAFKAKHNAAVNGNPAAHLGVWGSDPAVADVSVKVGSVRDARKAGKENKQEAAFALPGTEVRAGGVKIEDVANPWGGDILLNTQDIGKNDADRRFRRTRSNDHLSLNEVQNSEWDKVGGQNNGEDVTYGDVLRTINRGRVERQRNGQA